MTALVFRTVGELHNPAVWFYRPVDQDGSAPLVAYTSSCRWQTVGFLDHCSNGASCHHYPLLIPLSLSGSLGLVSTSDSVYLYLCFWLCPCLCFYSCLYLSLYRWPHLYIPIVYFCLSLFLSHLSFDSLFLSLTLSLLSIYISMSLLSVNPGYNSMVESLEDSRFEWDCPHSLNIWPFGPQLVPLFGDV